MPVLWVTEHELDQLQPLSDALLMAMGAIGQPAARSHLAQTLVRARIAPQAQPWISNPAGMSPLLNQLRDAGLTQEINQGFWALTPAAVEAVCRRAHRLGRLKPLAAAGQAAYDAGKVLLDGLGRDLAAFRLAFLEGRTEDWMAAQERLRATHRATLGDRDPLALICGQPFDPAWFETLPPAAQSHAAWALLYDQVVQDQPNAAFRAWMEARSHTKPSPLGPMLEFLILEGRLQEAVAHDQESLRLDPNDANARNNLGVALADLGRFDEAIAQYEEALRLDPSDAQARRNLEQALARSHRAARR